MDYLSDAPRDIATLTFDLAGDGPSRRYGSSSSICTPSLKFVGLSIQKIWRTSGLNIMSAWWPYLYLWPWNWCALLPVGSTIFLSILVLLGCFVLDLSANTCQTHHVTLRPWHLTLEVMALVTDVGLRAQSVYQVWNSYALPFGRYWTFTAWALLGLAWWPWPLTLKLMRIIAHEVDNLPQILVL